MHVGSLYPKVLKWRRQISLQIRDEWAVRSLCNERTSLVIIIHRNCSVEVKLLSMNLYHVKTTRGERNCSQSDDNECSTCTLIWFLQSKICQIMMTIHFPWRTFKPVRCDHLHVCAHGWSLILGSVVRAHSLRYFTSPWLYQQAHSSSNHSSNTSSFISSGTTTGAQIPHLTTAMPNLATVNGWSSCAMDGYPRQVQGSQSG